MECQPERFFTPHIADLVGPSETILTVKPKEHAVKQELEKIDESKRAILRLGLEIQRRFIDSSPTAWSRFWLLVRQDHGLLLREVEAAEATLKSDY